MKQRKKSILGLETTKTFIVVLLAVAIVAVITLIVLGALTSNTLIAQTGRQISGGYGINESLTKVNETSQTLLCGTKEISPTCSNFQASNTSGYLIGSLNYTTSNCAIYYSGATNNAGINNTVWTVSYNCAYRSSEMNSVTQNVSVGIISFFTNAGTYFALLGVVVIILIISLVVVVVNRFGGEGQSINQEGSI